MGMLVGLLAAAAAVAVLGTVVMRRRREAAGYDPDQAMASMVREGRDGTESGRGQMRSGTPDVSGSAGSTADDLGSPGSDSGRRNPS
jgi:hypothetical protein